MLLALAGMLPVSLNLPESRRDDSSTSNGPDPFAVFYQP